MASRPSTSRYLRPEPASLERRGARRWPVVIADATLRRHAAEPVTAVLNDLSTYGCRLASPGAHSPGDRVWLRLAGGLPIAATVVWSEGGKAGCRFDVGLPRETVRALTLGVA